MAIADPPFTDTVVCHLCGLTQFVSVRPFPAGDPQCRRCRRPLGVLYMDVRLPRDADHRELRQLAGALIRSMRPVAGHPRHGCRPGRQVHDQPDRAGPRVALHLFFSEDSGCGRSGPHRVPPRPASCRGTSFRPENGNAPRRMKTRGKALFNPSAGDRAIWITVSRLRLADTWIEQCLPAGLTGGSKGSREASRCPQQRPQLPRVSKL